MMYNKLTKKIAVAMISTAALLAGAVQAIERLETTKAG